MVNSITYNSSSTSNVGVGSFSFTHALNGTPYYIVVKSVDTVETWSASAQSFSSGVLSYDFTTLTARAYTEGSNPSLALHGGKYSHKNIKVKSKILLVYCKANSFKRSLLLQQPHSHLPERD